LTGAGRYRGRPGFDPGAGGGDVVVLAGDGGDKLVGQSAGVLGRGRVYENQMSKLLRKFSDNRLR
jgi:hypothetical protein